jgi:DNA-repair protein XRCC2
VQHHPSTLSSLTRGDFIEIQGPPASGKTHLLYHLLITAITPSEHSTLKSNGWDKAAVIFDTDGTFDIRRFHELLVNRLLLVLPTGSTPAGLKTLAQDLAITVVAKLHIFRPTSSVQLATSLTNLPAYLIAHLPDDEIGFLAIDSISSFYWPDRFTLEQISSSGNTARAKYRAASPLHHVLVALQKFRLSHGPVIAVTNWGLNPVTKPTRDSAPTTFYKQHLYPFPAMPKPYQINTSHITEANPAANLSDTSLPPLTHQITLPFVPITPFGPDILLDEAEEQESKYRSEPVRSGEIVGVVCTSGSTRVGRFTCRVAEDGALVGNIRS